MGVYLKLVYAWVVKQVFSGISIGPTSKSWEAPPYRKIIWVPPPPPPGHTHTVTHVLPIHWSLWWDRRARWRRVLSAWDSWARGGETPRRYEDIPSHGRRWRYNKGQSEGISLRVFQERSKDVLRSADESVYPLMMTWSRLTFGMFVFRKNLYRGKNMLLCSGVGSIAFLLQFQSGSLILARGQTGRLLARYVRNWLLFWNVTMLHTFQKGSVCRCIEGNQRYINYWSQNILSLIIILNFKTSFQIIITFSEQ